MALDDFLNQLATITVEPTPMTRDRIGGADRTAAWTTVAVNVPCLVRPQSVSLQSRDDARRDIGAARIYFAADPAPDGLGTRNRVVVNGATYQVQGVINPNSMSEIFHVDCEVIKNV